MKKILVSLLALTIFSITAYAIGSDLSIIEQGIELGKEYKGFIKISTGKRAVEVRVHDWIIDKAGNSVIYYNKKFKGDWLKIPKLIKKKKRSDNFIKIPYTIKVTSDKKQELLAKLLVSEVASPSKQNIDIALELGIPMYVWLKGGEKFGFDIEKAIYNSEKQTISAITQNKGNVHIRPSISMEIYQKKGIWPFRKQNLVTKAQLTNTWPILANSKRTFSKRLALDKGKYQVKFITSYGGVYQKKFSSEITKKLVVK